MKVGELLKQEKPGLSFEVFPPKKKENLESIINTASEIADIGPSYMSVTYGAAGTTALYTAEIASALLARNVTPVAHLTCINATEEGIREKLWDLKRRGVENILALRGDLPEGADPSSFRYRHASDLTAAIRDFGGFSIGGACYPETHPECQSSTEDIENLKKKVEAGCEYLVTQMFFDNDILYDFLYRMMRGGVNVPVVAGIMPVTNRRQIERIVSISGNALPRKFLRIVDRYGDNPTVMKEAGIAFATAQIIDLYANGINAVHVYSMNQPDVARAIRKNLSGILS